MVLSGADYMLLSAFSKVFARPSSLSTCSLTAFALTLLAAGEGSDEVFGGYLYFHKAPSKVEKGSGFCVKSNCSVTIVYCLQLLVTHTLAFHVLRGHLHGPLPLCYVRVPPWPWAVICGVLIAPAQEELQSETVRKIQDLYKYDCLRANKSTMSWGVEARVPFLDKEFLEVSTVEATPPCSLIILVPQDLCMSTETILYSTAASPALVPW